MSSAQIQVSVNIETQECANCGVIFGMPDYLVKMRRQDGSPFYCPNGHNLVFKSEIDRLKKELDKVTLRAQTAEADALYRKNQAERIAAQAERQRRADKAKFTRMRNRIAKGFCPCCNQHFPDVLEHMRAEHPREAPAAVLLLLPAHEER